MFKNQILVISIIHLIDILFFFFINISMILVANIHKTVVEKVFTTALRASILGLWSKNVVNFILLWKTDTSALQWVHFHYIFGVLI